MSRLTDLIAQTKAADPALGHELEREFKSLASRRAFGLNFERHRPETVELPGRPVRRGDKVRVLPPRGSTQTADQKLWRVTGFETTGAGREAKLEGLGGLQNVTCNAPVADLVVVAEFRDYIYPGLVSTGKVERGGDKPFHTVINGENFHALEALTFTHRGKIDAIYIDPPYNTGARDWKYNNDYVEADDLYRHSKWLAMMERRLLVARELLNPLDSVLIITIDEKEYLRLGMLLEQLFPDAAMEMVTSVISAKGVARVGQFSRVEEFIFFVRIGEAKVEPGEQNMLDESRSASAKVGLPVDWLGLRRREPTARRGARPNQFYPIFVARDSGYIHSIGDPIPQGIDRESIEAPAGTVAVWPLRPNGEEGLWGITPETAREYKDRGFIRSRNVDLERGRAAIHYLPSGTVASIREGRIEVVGHDPDGAVQAVYREKKGVIPKRVWNMPSHNAENGGSTVLSRLVPGRRFPFPKSIYAVEDALRFFVGSKPKAVILDFFAGSGTTAQAVMRLNRQDGGRRQCILVTNNEVGADEQTRLAADGHRPGESEWERWGICEHITKPRLRAAITGKTPEGEKVKGAYKFVDEFPMAAGFDENAEFFTLTYETPVAVAHNRAFERIAPLLWMRAGSRGARIDKVPEAGWQVLETYGLLVDLDVAAPFTAGIWEAGEELRIAYIVTDDERRFQSIVRQLPSKVEPVRLYESYLTNFRFVIGR